MKKVLVLAVVTSVAMFAQAGDWTFDSNTISDGTWTLKVDGALNNGAITITGVSSGSGVLDLRDMTVGGVAVTALSIGDSAFRGCTGLTAFYANNVTGELVQTFRECSGLTTVEIDGDGLTAITTSFLEKCTALESVKMEVPNLVTIGSWTFLNCSNLKTIKLNGNKVTSIGERAFNGCSSLDCPVSDYLNSNTVSTIGPGAFRTAKVNGDIVLNNIATIGTRAFCQSSITGFYINGGTFTEFPGESDGVFEQCYSMTSLVIRAENFNSFGQYSLWRCGALSNMRVSSKQVVAVDSYTFGYCSKLTEVTFDGPAPTSASLDTILREISETTGKKNCTLYCSRRQEGWVELASALTDGEKSANPPEDCFGVYREGSRKAWMVDVPSPFDPAESGTVYVTSDPAAVGVPSPGFGQHQDVEDGTEFTTAEYFISGSDLYRATGFRIEEYEAGNWNTVSNGTLRSWVYRSTDKMQRVTWLYEVAGGVLTIRGDSEFDVSVSPAPIIASGGKNAYTNGTPMVIEAADFTERPVSTFDSWSGDIPAGADPKDRQLAFAFSGARTLTVHYASKDWVRCTVSDGKKTYSAISNRVWTLRQDAASDIANGFLSVYDAWSGEGVLDLRDISVDGHAIERLELTNFCFGRCTGLTGIYANRLDSDLEGTFAECGNLVFAELSGEGVRTMLHSGSSGVFDSCDQLEYLKLDFPNLRSLDKFVFFNCKKLTNDVSTLVPQAVTSIGCRCFIGCALVRGKLVLDRCDALHHGALRGLGADEIVLGDGDLTTLVDQNSTEEPAKPAGMFEDCKNLTNLVIMAHGLEYIGTNAFKNCQNLKTITFGAQGAVTIAPSDATRPALTGVTFNGPALTTESLDNLLAGVSAKDGKKDCLVYASANQAGWTGLADELTAGEEADNAPAKCFGVYRDGSRKAYLVRRRSCYDPPGLMIFFR